MADETTQKLAHGFFIEHLNSLEPFTKADVIAATGWAEASADAYWSKQFKNILEPIGNDQYRVRDRFRLYLDWKKFKSLVTQVKTAPPTYAPTVYDEIVVYEFYMPLSHESALKVTLDSLFYKDILLPRLKLRIGIDKLKEHFEYLMISVTTGDGSRQAVLTYLALKNDASLRPYHWYKAFVAAGAVEHGLPPAYVEWLRTFESQPDDDLARRSENEAILFEK